MTDPEIPWSVAEQGALGQRLAARWPGTSPLAPDEIAALEHAALEPGSLTARLVVSLGARMVECAQLHQWLSEEEVERRTAVKERDTWMVEAGRKENALMATQRLEALKYKPQEKELERLRAAVRRVREAERKAEQAENLLMLKGPENAVLVTWSEWVEKRDATEALFALVPDDEGGT